MRDPGFSLLVLASIFHWDFGFRVDTVPLLAYPRTIFVLPLHTLILTKTLLLNLDHGWFYCRSANLCVGISATKLRR